MNQAPDGQSNARVVAPDEAERYWQPVPASGFVRNILGPATTGSENNFSMGRQTVAPGCLIREHTHDRNEETTPEPFRRPDNVAKIEARTVFGWTDASFGPKKG